MPVRNPIAMLVRIIWQWLIDWGIKVILPIRLPQTSDVRRSGLRPFMKAVPLWLREKLRIEQLDFPHSLGLLYSAFTSLTGFRVNSAEYKLMGLAPRRGRLHHSDPGHVAGPQVGQGGRNFGVRHLDAFRIPHGGR